jgi:hypothetical protein
VIDGWSDEVEQSAPEMLLYTAPGKQPLESGVGRVVVFGVYPIAHEADSIHARVNGPTYPVGLIEWAAWNFLTAARVIRPKNPLGFEFK